MVDHYNNHVEVRMDLCGAYVTRSNGTARLSSHRASEAMVCNVSRHPYTNTMVLVSTCDGRSLFSKPVVECTTASILNTLQSGMYNVPDATTYVNECPMTREYLKISRWTSMLGRMFGWIAFSTRVDEFSVRFRRKHRKVSTHL